MPESVRTHTDRLRNSIAGLEAQRAALGDAIVEPALAALRQQLAALEAHGVPDTAAPAPSLEGERRLVTILFTDIVGSTSLAAKLDPEEWKEIVSETHRIVSDAVFRYQGTIAQLLGDGVLAFFGAPITHEDDPARAVRAALDIQGGMANYGRTLPGYVENLKMRVGLNTGTVVVGNVGSDLHMEYLAIGDSVNLASRLQTAAAPGKVLISDATARLVRGAFELKALGEIEVKGKSEPIAVYEVIEAKVEHERGRGVGRLRSPLVGREKEMEAVRATMAGLLEGHGQIIGVMGEAGIGKSRLLEELRGPAGAGSVPALEFSPRWLEGRSLSYGQSLSFWAINQIIRSDLGLTDGDPEPKVRAHLRRRVTALFGERANQILPYLAHLLGIRLEGELAERVRVLDGETLKRQTLLSIADYFAGLAHEQPTVFVFEDLHWADPSTLAALEGLFPLTDRVPLMLLLLFRAERDHGSWRLKLKAETDFAHRYTEIDLKPLSSEDSNRLVDNYLEVADLSENVRHLLLEKSEGNPFYLEEIIRSLIEQGAIARGDQGWRAIAEMGNITIPDTLQEVLLARIDRLEEDVRRTLQLASVIGRSFLYRLLEAIAEAERELDRHLAQLQRVDLVREKTRRPELEYIFKHSLTQEAAYNSLLVERRKEFHRKVGEALEKLFADRRAEFYSLLGHHFDLGGEREKAVEYLILAGDKARVEDAHEEAIDHYRRALELLRQMGDEARAVRTWLKLGLVYHGNFQFQAAHEAYDAAFELQRHAREMSAQPTGASVVDRGATAGREAVLRLSLSSPLATIDPARCYYLLEAWIIDSLFAGLGEMDAEMNILPHAARSWQVLDGGTRYLIYLRDDVRWTDGSPVTASDFEWAWKRNLDPRTGSDTAPLLDEVVGARDFREGRTADADTIGVRALDAWTLEVRLACPVAYFPYLFTRPITFPLHRASVEHYAEDWWKPEHIVSNGPFRLAQLDLRRGGVLERNPAYFGEFPGNLRRVEWSVTADDTQTVQDYLENRADVSLSFAGWSGATGLDAVPSSERFDASVVRTVFMVFSPHLPPLDDSRVRRALIHALDRKRIAEMLFKSGVPPARGGLIPPGLAGHSPELGPGYNLETARRLFSEAGYLEGKGFPRLTGYVKWIFSSPFEEIARQWREGLGIEVDSQVFMPGEQPVRLDRHFAIIGWLADYPDPDNFMRQSDGYWLLRRSGWRDGRFEELVEQAARTPDRRRRLAMYREADRIWVEEQTLVVPLFYGAEWTSLVKPWVKGYQMSKMTDVIFKNITMEH